MNSDTPNRTSAWLDFAQRSRDDGGLGLAPHQAAGLVGNLVNESGQDLNPWGPSGDNGSAWGTAQWRGDRLARLQQRPDYQTMAGQQAFMREEMDGPEAASYAALRAARTPEEAASAVNKFYERSADTSGQRERDAHDLMAQFGPDASPGALTSSMMSTTRGRTSPMADANDDGALSTNNVIGGGVLNNNNGGLMDSIGNKFGISGLGNSLLGMASALSSGTNPEQSKVLGALQTTKADNEYSFVTLPNGQVMRVNKNGSYEMLPGNFAKPGDAQKAHAVDPSILKNLSEDWGSKYGNIQYSAEKAAEFEDKLAKGELSTDLMSRGLAGAENFFGKTSPQAQALNSFESFRTSMANDSLRLNKGVQTEGDALRAKEELVSAFASNDSATIKNALHNYVTKMGKVMQGGAKSQLDSYSAAYDNPEAFKPYYDRLQTQQSFYDNYHKNHPDSAPTAPIAPGTRPPLSSFNR